MTANYPQISMNYLFLVIWEWAQTESWFRFN